VTDTDLLLSLATRVDATHVNRLIGSVRLHRASIYFAGATAVNAGIVTAPEFQWADGAGLGFTKDSNKTAFIVGGAGTSVQSLHLRPPPKTLVGEWFTTPTPNNMIVVSSGAGTTFVLELDLEFTLEVDSPLVAVTVASTTSSQNLLQRVFTPNVLPVGYSPYTA
jgi:hypothetical protein